MVLSAFDARTGATAATRVLHVAPTACAANCHPRSRTGGCAAASYRLPTGSVLDRNAALNDAGSTELSRWSRDESTRIFSQNLTSRAQYLILADRPPTGSVLHEDMQLGVLEHIYESIVDRDDSTKDHADPA